MLTDENLILERNGGISGRQRIYRFPNGHGLSLVNGYALHHYPFAWEAAVLKDVTPDGGRFEINYDTPLTDDVMVFGTDDEANEFIAKAASYFAELGHA